MGKSLNKVLLIGNLTRDVELRYTPQGSAVCNFGIATNRSWTKEDGEKKEEADFHNIVAWGKLAELCNQLLTKGKRVYVEGRLTTQKWTSKDGIEKTRTEIVIDDMMMLDRKETNDVQEVKTAKEEKAEDALVDEVDKGIEQQKMEEME